MYIYIYIYIYLYIYIYIYIYYVYTLLIVLHTSYCLLPVARGLFPIASCLHGPLGLPMAGPVCDPPPGPLIACLDGFRICWPKLRAEASRGGDKQNNTKMNEKI